MPNNVEAAFKEFARGLRPSSVENAAAVSHRASIEAKLKQSFGMTAFFRTGSFGNGTAVTGCSDVDYFAVIPTERLRQDSSITLQEVAAALRERFPRTPNIRVNSPGIQLPFGFAGDEHTEIVPVDRTGTTTLGFRQFDMPDGNGGWMFSAPESHKAFVDHHDQRLGGELKPLIRCVKAWKFFRNVPVRSFYVEMFVAAHMANEASVVLAIDVRNILQRMADTGFRKIVDPRFPNMELEACSTELRRSEAVEKAEMAARWADQAMVEEYANRTEAAFDRWNLVFNYQFPSYTPGLATGLGFR